MGCPRQVKKCRTRKGNGCNSAADLPSLYMGNAPDNRDVEFALTLEEFAQHVELAEELIPEYWDLCNKYGSSRFTGEHSLDLQKEIG